MHLDRLEEQGAHARELLHAIEKRREYLEQQARRAPSRSRPVRVLRQSKLSRPSSPVPKKARRRNPKAEEERRALGENAMRDARCATTLDERWVKGWIRLAEAAQLVAECEDDPTPERAAARRMQLMAAHRAAEMVASLSSEK